VGLAGVRQKAYAPYEEVEEMKKIMIFLLTLAFTVPFGLMASTGGMAKGGNSKGEEIARDGRFISYDNAIG